MTLCLASIAYDLQLSIFLLLDVRDVLSLKQTNRALHACGSSEFLWHRISERLPLPMNILPKTELNDISGPELQRLVLRAMDVEANWKRAMPVIRRCTPIKDNLPFTDAAIDDMLLLANATMLVTAQRFRRNGLPVAAMHLWVLREPEKIYRAASLEFPGYYRKIAAHVDEEHSLATFAIAMYVNDQADNSILQIYEAELLDRSQSEYALLSSPRRRPFQMPKGARGIVHDVVLQDNLAAAMLVDFDADFPGHSYQIYIINTKTWATKLIHPKFSEPITRLSLKLSPNRIVLVGATPDTVVLREINLPQDIVSTIDHFRYRPMGDEEADFVEDLGYLTELSISSCSNPIDSDTLMFHSPMTVPDVLSLLFFDLQDMMPGHGHLVRLYFSKESPVHRQDKPFPLPPEASVKLARIGRTGRRAVYIEHDWSTDESRLMRAHFPPEDPDVASVGVLIPPWPVNPALPFTPRACQSLAFDETTGRLCCGTFDGDIWVLDYSW